MGQHSEPFEVNGVMYQCRNLDVFDQLIVAKRISPLIKGVLSPEVLGAAMAAEPQDVTPAASGRVKSSKIAATVQATMSADMLGTIIDAFHSMEDDDVKIVTKLCLGVCVRQQKDKGGAWVPITTPAGDLQFQDMGLAGVLQVTAKVIMHHLSDFFSTAL